MTNYVKTPDLRALHVITRLCAYHSKLYCYPTYETLKELIEKFTGRRVSVRSLARHLGALERDGWLRRQRRHKTGPTGELQLHSTLYMMTKRACSFARATISDVWQWSTGALKSLMDIALPLVAETLDRENKSYDQRPRKRPPKR